MGFKNLKRLVPIKLKLSVKAAVQEYRFRRAVTRIAALSPGQTPSRRMLTDLSIAWGNEGYAANIDYLEEVAGRAATTFGPILECGTGVTTILLGLLAGKRGVEIWSLEHSPEWQKRVIAALQHNEIPQVSVHLAPLRAYEGFSWYDPPLENMPGQFRFVVCDGPPAATPGGRYGLFPVLGKRLPPDVLILLDDANRSGELELLDQWSLEADVKVAFNEKPSGTFALVTRR